MSPRTCFLRRAACAILSVGLSAGFAAACAPVSAGASMGPAAPPVHGMHGAVPRPASCPAASFFHPERDVVVTVPEGYGRIDLTHGHTLEFDVGAVPAGSRYRISRARPAFAALRIEPVGDAPDRFDGLARLSLNFAPCGLDGDQPGFGIYRWGRDDVLVPVASQRTGERVDAFLTGLSVYAIGSN